MVSGERDFRLRLPTRWPQWARSAMLHALSLARIALLAATDRVATSVRLEHELALLREELRIKDAVIVMLNLPLALIGGAIGVFVSGGVLSVASIIGFVALFGIATRNGIMMISHIRHLLEEEGETSLHQAVVRGARERLVPILMTALSAGLALVPLALAGARPGAELEAPMAVVILFGLLSATALNMVVVPIVYLRFSRMRERYGA